MDSTTLLFAAGIVGFIVLIIIILSYTSLRQRQKEGEKHEKYFYKSAATLGITVTKKDLLHHHMIGWDEQQNRLIFIDYTRNPLLPVSVELKDVSGSRLMVNNDSVIEKIRGADKVTDVFISSVKLQLKFRNGHTMPAELTFYRYGVDALHELEQLKQVAGSWNDHINEHSGDLVGRAREMQAS